ncbi:hypothetical protein [Methylobacterium sp. 37f]|uniref:hypothetical protein n=1 Tax=Methylobacterium sp. 37f TaxID=2817058 RepID=UPI001FFCC5D7|nr:hypothetical protein [Methylobacterium sp. 37f]MCK2056946.1 hypothetical protein [Methylobacterium sp. 37f]
MNQAHLITVRDFEDGCPVPAEMLGRLYRADAETLSNLIAGISQRTRAQLAVFLYGRIHTRELGVRIAAMCEAALLMQTAGTLGEVIYAQSRTGYERPTYGEVHRPLRSAISLAGSRKTGDLHA